MQAVDAPVLTSSVPHGSASAAAVRPVDTIVEEAFEAYAGRLKAFAVAAVRDDAAADDLVQETFLRYVRQVRSHEVPDNVGGWLYRVCANLVISRGRRQAVAERLRGLLVDRSTVPSPEERVLRADEHVHIRAALADMPADARVALLMAAEGFSSAEIGLAIGRTAGATATYICRARVRLRERLATREAGLQ
jgi:RNA polymerase sigma-70 factor (ECF subfamily)